MLTGEKYDRFEALSNIKREYLMSIIKPHTGNHQLFGYPHISGNKIMFQCQLVTNGISCLHENIYDSPEVEKFKEGVKDWNLLFQVDSDENTGLMWGNLWQILFCHKKRRPCSR